MKVNKTMPVILEWYYFLPVAVPFSLVPKSPLPVQEPFLPLLKPFVRMVKSFTPIAEFFLPLLKSPLPAVVFFYPAQEPCFTVPDPFGYIVELHLFLRGHIKRAAILISRSLFYHKSVRVLNCNLLTCLYCGLDALKMLFTYCFTSNAVCTKPVKGLYSVSFLSMRALLQAVYAFITRELAFMSEFNVLVNAATVRSGSFGV